MSVARSISTRLPRRSRFCCCYRHRVWWRRRSCCTVPNAFPHLRCAIDTVTYQRIQAHHDPDRYLPDLADSLSSLGASLQELGRYGEALTAVEEAVTVYRDLVERVPDRYLPDLARSLTNLGASRWELERTADSFEAYRESVAVWKLCADHDPELHGPPYQRAVAALRKRLAETGHHDEAIMLGLTHRRPSPSPTDQPS
jgi:tetratricopeptide (TPR) repeat protein